MDVVEYGDMATWPSAGKGLPLQGNVFAVTWEGSGKGFGVWWTVQAEVLAGQSRTPAVIPGAAPPGPRLGRGRRIYIHMYTMHVYTQYICMYIYMYFRL